MRRLRVCFVVESGTDVRLIDGLAERYDTTVLARAIRGGAAVNRPSTTDARVVVGPAARIRFALWAAARVFRERPRPDFVIAQGCGLGALLTQVVCQARVPSAMLVCSPAEEYYESRRLAGDPDKPFRRIEFAAVRLLGRMNGRLGAHAIVLSHHLATTLRAHGGPLQIDIVPVYGVDVGVFRPSDESRDRLRQTLGLPPAGAIIFFSSRVAPEKDVATLLAAFARLLAAGRDIWLLHRSGGYREFVRLAEREGVAGRVIATDAVHPVLELRASYAASDLCVQASRAEGLGFSVLEALACETPVVASAVGGLCETVFDGETGWTYPPGDSEALARTIAVVLDSPDEARRRATAGRRMVLERYERTRVFERLDRVIVDAVSRRP